MVFPVNCWYVACTQDELLHEPLGRKICGHNLVFFRGEEGKVSAVEDFCPHRGAPLSLGCVKEGLLVCGYHGLKMGGDGKAVEMPQQKVERFPSIRSFPVVERYGFVWIWPGSPELADPAQLPEFEWADDREWAYGGGVYHIHCDYRLMIDNLMDLTHETYVHATSIGQDEIDETPVSTKLDGDTVVTSRFMEGVMPPPFWRMALQANDLADDQLVDRWQVCRFSPPSHVMIDVGVAYAGTGGKDALPQNKVNSTVVDFITPESETSMWYFWGMARQFKIGDAALTDRIREGQGKIFSEDMEMLEGQQRNLESFPERRLLKLNIDAGGVHARRIIEKQIKLEGTPGET